jgi:hypothetical protein
MTDTDFPVLDGPRPFADGSLGRSVIDSYGFVEAYVEEMDDWTSMPLRLTHDQGSGFQLELGPYTLDVCDIAKLRAAIAGFDARWARRHD